MLTSGENSFMNTLPHPYRQAYINLTIIHVINYYMIHIIHQLLLAMNNII